MEKKWILLILCFLLIGIVKESFIAVTTPNNIVFNGYGSDEAHLYTSLKAYEFGFVSPWIMPSDPVKDNFFNNPGHGPIFLMTLLGLFYFISGISPMVIFAVFKFFSAVFLIFVFYYFAREFSRNNNESKITFLLLIFTAGLGGIIVIAFRLLTNPAEIFESFSLFGFGVGTLRLLDFYQSLPFMLSILSLITLSRKKYIISGILLGIATLIYPLFGFMMFITFILYEKIFDKKWAKNIIKIIVVLIPFFVILASTYLSNSYFLSLYSQANKSLGVVVLPSILLGIGIPLFFIIYKIGKDIKIKSWKIYILLWTIAIGLITASQLSQSYWSRNMDFFGIVSFAGIFYPLLEIPFYLMFLHLVYTFIKEKNPKGKKYVFFVSWLFLISVIIFSPVAYAPWIPLKLVPFMILPVSLIAARGIVEFSKKYKISTSKIVAVVIILSLPSIILINAFDLPKIQAIRNNFGPQNVFYSKSDYNAMLFLKSQPFGTVFCSGYTGTYLPYYTGKKSLLFDVNRTDTVYNAYGKQDDYKKFFSASTDEKIEILKSYNITYVFYGTFEKSEGVLENEPFFVKIYDADETQIYEVSGVL